MGPRGVQTDYNDFAPRLGLAWSPNPKWTIRVGSGFFYSQDAGTPKLDPANSHTSDTIRMLIVEKLTLLLDALFGIRS